MIKSWNKFVEDFLKFIGINSEQYSRSLSEYSSSGAIQTTQNPLFTSEAIEFFLKLNKYHDEFALKTIFLFIKNLRNNYCKASNILNR